ncbi:hypothetical protein C8R44DRAFT_926893 [Mycena epipterygia]|nr:hypothetical protein C8R44DRAFT_926893 [Mycena epipterygia]
MPRPASSPMLSASLSNEKSARVSASKGPSFKLRAFTCAGLFAIVVLLSLRARVRHRKLETLPACPQVPPLLPRINARAWQQTHARTAAPAFKARAIDWLAGAIRIPTESYDNMQPVGTDPRWAAFGPLHMYLARAFPLLHARLRLRTVNTYALWYEWAGADAALKPVLLAAHQDVVPVDPATLDEWTHPPYSGHFDGERIWGRGAADDKNGLVGILAAIETLLENDFTPARTVVLAFGFDEEASGREGAGELAKVLLSTYGVDAFAFIVDEGAGLASTFGTLVAFPGVAEKGYLDVVAEVSAPGGHSSVPPLHTSIGMLAAMLVQYEENPYPLHLTRDSTPYHTIQCLAAHTLSMPPAIRRLVQDSLSSDSALRALEGVLSKDPLYRAQIGTTGAVDVIGGGVKSNVLPEQARAVINHRVAAESSVAAVRAHDTELLRPVAERFNLTYTAFGRAVGEEADAGTGALTLSDLNTYNAIEPAPVTPTDGADAAAYRLLAGSIVETYETRSAVLGGGWEGEGDDDTRTGGEGDRVIVAPFTMSGNTDTRYYWALSRHIFRYGHGNSKGRALGDLRDGMHTVDESIDADDFVEMVRFFVTLILNADESVLV